MARKPATADVCLIVEGAYPYVRGGVSSWVHALIKALPDTTFSVLHIAAERHAKLQEQYELPPNVLERADVFIHETIVDGSPKSAMKLNGRRKHAGAWQAVRQFHEATNTTQESRSGPAVNDFKSMLAAFDGHAGGPLSVADALFSHEAWEYLCELYGERAVGTSFVDYFWTWRAMHAPVLQTLIAEIPPARLYHAISTGYAGLLGARAKRETGRPLLLTEHGIYVRERNIDIARANWIYEEPTRVRVPEPDANPLKRMWTRLFSTLASMTYDASDEIITLFQGNQLLQLQLGARPERVRIIPNGVRPEDYKPLRQQRRKSKAGPLRVGFLGRVVAIKDIKTLLRAYAILARDVRDVEFLIVGSTDEEPEYYKECVSMAQDLTIPRLRFLPFQDARDIYKQIDVLALTSVSEGQPLVILEAACAGVPTVATDVGACRELIEGRDPQDAAFGPCGIVTSVAAPEETARGIKTLLQDCALRRAAATAGVRRTERYYRQQDVVDDYRQLYQRHMAAEA